MGWLLHILGVDDMSSRWYAFWSGFGSDLGYAAILGGLWRHHNCHVRGCWRLGRHQLQGTEWKLCRKHHPDDAPTHAEVLSAGRRKAKVKT